MSPNQADSPANDPDHNDPGFQTVLKALVDVYRPILEEDLKRAGDLAALGAEAEKAPPDCEAEIAAAQRLFGQFADEKVTLALLPPQARELLGPAERWRWCQQHIRCCIIFGWLLCRRPRSFRLSAYYLYRYWLCVRQVLGTPVTPGKLSDAEHRDLSILVAALAKAYRPYLTDQLATTDFTTGLPEAIDAGEVDCNEGEEEAAEIFERLLTEETAEALLGAAAFKQHRHEPWFWFCRCWCLCAIRFGCCLARARNLIDVYRCLKAYWRCLRECFRPLTCQLTGPQGCVTEQVNAAIPALVVPITGTAAGAGFIRYVLEWSLNGIVWHATNFVYPPVPPVNTMQGNTPVSAGLLAYFDTTLLNAGTYFVRMAVFGTNQAPVPCQIIFSVFKKDVRILGVGSNTTLSAPWSDPAARLVDNVSALCARPASTEEASFGGTCLQVLGSAYIAGCDDQQKIKRYTLDYKAGDEPDCTTPGWTNFWSVEFSTPAQYRAINMRTDTSVLTAVWTPDCLVPVPFPPWCLLVDPQGLLSPSSWNSVTNPMTCQLSGLFTIRLVVEDTNGVSYCDTQRVWLDNKPITALIRIDAVPKCADLFISEFAPRPDCSVPWELPVSGIAYDEYIYESGFPPGVSLTTRPNDNFDHYVVSVTKQGGPSISIPIPGPGGTCFHGLKRVGDPGTRCGLGVVGPEMIGVLTSFDLRAIDPDCSLSLPYAVPAGFTTPRGECCVYTFGLTVYDRTARPCGISHADSIWPVKICNDLKKP
ncbi:hypothetical protein [Neoroseomonas soli]|uniref:Uncharacterized protein n=1 Tax=Neoroseomonas soli TaxID=1081025 RepID=A0A9X9WTL0_9PROT|nr:hypothetical protein [Neoroseomonas soli]MBR0670489.1 hypothetical protein [Neoroseomonas soli]